MEIWITWREKKKNDTLGIVCPTKAARISDKNYLCI
jgi:hypothetical protein